jgi:hypothetical protein
MLGTGALGLSLLGFGLVGLLQPTPVGLFIVLVLVVVRSEAAKLPGLTRSLYSVCTRDLQNRLLFAAYSFFVLLLVIRALSPPWAIDEVIYHLPSTKSFVEEGRVYPLYHQALGNMPLLIHMIYAICLMAKADIATRLLSLFLTLITALAIKAFCDRFLNNKTGLVAMFGFLSAAMVVEVGISSRIDVTLAGMLFLATYSIMVYLDTKQVDWLLVAAVLSGFAIGIKLNALIWFFLMLVMFLVEGLKNRESILRITQHAVLFASVTALIACPWLIKNAFWFHNPVYPFITGEVAQFDHDRIRYFDQKDEQRLDSHFDNAQLRSPERVDSIWQTLRNAEGNSEPRHPFRFWEFYTRPSGYSMGDYNHYSNFSFVVLPLFILFSRPKWLVWLLLLSVSFFLFIAWTSWLARFLLPIYPGLTVVTAFTIVEAGRRLGGRWISRLPFYVIGASLTLPAMVSLHSIRSMKNLEFLVGTVSREEFLSNLFYYPPLAFINHNLAANARILSVGAEMCYHMHRPYLSDASWDATEWRRLLIRNSSLSDVNSDLKRQGVTHVLFFKDYFEFIVLNGWPKPGGANFLATGKFADPNRLLKFGRDYNSLRNWVTFDHYRQDFLELVYSDQNGYELYRIK